jgi:hypothetical protein
LERDLQRSENNEESCWETASIRAWEILTKQEQVLRGTGTILVGFENKEVVNSAWRHTLQWHVMKWLQRSSVNRRFRSRGICSLWGAFEPWISENWRRSLTPQVYPWWTQRAAQLAQLAQLAQPQLQLGHLDLDRMQWTRWTRSSRCSLCWAKSRRHWRSPCGDHWGPLAIKSVWYPSTCSSKVGYGWVWWSVMNIFYWCDGRIGARVCQELLGQVQQAGDEMQLCFVWNCLRKGINNIQR